MILLYAFNRVIEKYPFFLTAEKKEGKK